MPQVINTNVSALTSQRNLNGSQNSLATALQRLSSGLRINSAKDDAAGLAISNRFTAQINGLNQAARNANDGISLAQTAEGGLSTVGDALQRIRELAVQSANGTNSSSDRAALQLEANQLLQEVTRIATTTQFNGSNVLDGTLTGAQFQVGANAGQTITFGIASAKGADLGTQNLRLAGGASSGVSMASAPAASSSVVNRVAAQNLSLFANNQTTTLAVTAGQSASSIAANINLSTASSGVTAQASTAAVFGTISATGTVSFNIASQSGVSGVATASATIAAAVTNTADLSGLAAAINAATATTGISAAINVGSLTLTNSSGADIVIGDYTNTGAGTASFQGANGFTSAYTTTGSAATLTSGGTDSAAVGGQIRLDSSGIYSLGSTVNSSGGLVSGSSGASGASYATLVAASSINISTVLGANDALAIVDKALDTVNTIRAGLGALQNRFTATVNNLQISAENGAASRSRILDADFAAETSALSRAQILQQAGIATLAQANAVPNNVLALLQ